MPLDVSASSGAEKPISSNFQLRGGQGAGKHTFRFERVVIANAVVSAMTFQSTCQGSPF